MKLTKSLLSALAICLAPSCFSQHLIWHPAKDHKPYTCIYGEIEVLATSKTVYYCGCNWWPGNPAGGYTGIQDPGGGRHNMIFSIWDTSPTLHPRVTAADSRAVFNRFGGEGTGAHTHLDYNWRLGGTYRFYATKIQDAKAENTLTALYFYDEGLRKWVHEATISNPNDGHESVRTFGGYMNAFLENWSGQDRAAPKLAIYRLWAGTSPRDLVNVTEGSGDGKWGVLDDTFYLAEGDESALAPMFAKHHDVVRGKADRSKLSVKSRGLSRRVVRELENLPQAPVAVDRH